MRMDKIIIGALAIFLLLQFFAAPLASAADPTVSVSSNAGFTPAGFSGSGTSGDPYILQNKMISAIAVHGIYIEDTTAYFIIRNCTVYGGGTFFNGIYLYNVTNGRIENCTVYDNNYGIALGNYCRNSTITGNIAYNNTDGIHGYYCSNNTAIGNRVYNNTYGIHLNWHFDYNTLTSNTVYNNTYDGIYLEDNCNNNNLTSNTAYSNHIGIHLFISLNNILTGNIAYGNNWTGIGFDTTSNNNSLNSNIAYNNTYGILFIGCHNNTLTGNTAYSNNDSGIYFMACSNNTLTSNIIYYNIYGIQLCNDSNNYLTGNMVYNNTNGILLLINSNGNTLTSNNIFNNIRGISILGDSNDNTLNDNYVHNNVWDFYSDETCTGNVANNLHIYCYPVNISFTYGNGIAIVGVPIGLMPPTPPYYESINMYLNITDVTKSSWILLNVSYTESDIAGLNEDSLRLYRWYHTAWELADGSGINNVNTAKDYVYANITEFGIVNVLGITLQPVGGFVLPAEAPVYAAIFIIMAIASGAVVAIVARKRIF